MVYFLKSKKRSPFSSGFQLATHTKKKKERKRIQTEQTRELANSQGREKSSFPYQTKNKACLKQAKILENECLGICDMKTLCPQSKERKITAA